MNKTLLMKLAHFEGVTFGMVVTLDFPNVIAKRQYRNSPNLNLLHFPMTYMTFYIHKLYIGKVIENR